MANDLSDDEVEALLTKTVRISAGDFAALCESTAAQHLLTIGELRTRRSIKEFLSWVSEVVDRLFQSKETRDIARLCGRPYKEFREEALPFRAFASVLAFPERAIVSLPVDDGPADVLVENLEGRREPLAIQMVNCSLDKDENLRMQLLTKSGHTPGVGHIEKTDKSKSGYNISARSQAVARSVTIEQKKARIAEQLKKKQAKDYPAGSWLLVVFDDLSYIDSKGYEEIIAFSRLRIVAPSTFGKIYAVCTGHCSRVSELS